MHSNKDPKQPIKNRNKNREMGLEMVMRKDYPVGGYSTDVGYSTDIVGYSTDKADVALSHIVRAGVLGAALLPQTWEELLVLFPQPY